MRGNDVEAERQAECCRAAAATEETRGSQQATNVERVSGGCRLIPTSSFDVELGPLLGVPVKPSELSTAV